jgi:hypothetical protein
MKNCFNSAIWSLSIAIILLTQTTVPSCIAMPLNIWRGDADNHGLTDLHRRTIVPAIYASIDYQGHGIFRLRPRDPVRKLFPSGESLLVDRGGRKVLFQLPPDAGFQKVVYFGQKCETNPQLVQKELASDALLVYIARLGGRLGVCNKLGKIIVPSDYQSIDYAGSGKLKLQRESETYSLDLKTEEQRLEILFGEPIVTTQVAARTQPTAARARTQVSPLPQSVLSTPPIFKPALPQPSKSLPNSKSVSTYREIAPGILLKTIRMSDDEFNKERDKYYHRYPGMNRFN